MRKAREWFGTFSPTSQEDLQKVGTFGSQENAYFRMVTSYWDMAASFVTSGVLNEELFLQTNGEALFVWEKIREHVSAARERMKNPMYMANLEKVGTAAINRMKSLAPEAYENFSAMVRGAAAASAQRQS